MAFPPAPPAPGITRIHSSDGSVNVTNQFGPVVDLSVPLVPSPFAHMSFNYNDAGDGSNARLVHKVVDESGGNAPILVLPGNSVTHPGEWIVIQQGGDYLVTFDAVITNISGGNLNLGIGLALINSLSSFFYPWSFRNPPAGGAVGPGVAPLPDFTYDSQNTGVIAAAGVANHHFEGQFAFNFGDQLAMFVITRANLGGVPAATIVGTIDVDGFGF